MRFYRNPEVRKQLLAHVLVALIAALAAWKISGAQAMLIVLLSAAALTLLHLYSTRRRYRAIAELSDSIDRVLHDSEINLIALSSEGELSILRAEIQKMVVRLRQTASALQSDKTQLSDAIADISHQLRTPLTSMNLTVSLLRREDVSDARRIELARELQKSLRRIDWLIETLLKLSRIDAGTAKFESDCVSVKTLIDRALEPLRISMELRGLEAEVSAGGEAFTGDLSWSVEALGNIVKNCVEHTPAGGKIRISARETPIFTEIQVSDTGSGFEKDDIPHLFERFYRGQNASEGSVGIGLALAREIIARQNGTIQAQNRREGGAQFTIRFYKEIV